MAPQAQLSACLADKLLQLQAPTVNSNSQPACLRTDLRAGQRACLPAYCQPASLRWVTRRVLTLTLNPTLTLTVDRACGDALRVSSNPNPNRRPRLR